jgi:hypothetical protein
MYFLFADMLNRKSLQPHYWSSLNLVRFTSNVSMEKFSILIKDICVVLFFLLWWVVVGSISVSNFLGNEVSSGS